MGKMRKAVTAAIILIVFVFVPLYSLRRGQSFFYSMVPHLTEKSNLRALPTPDKCIDLRNKRFH